MTTGKGAKQPYIFSHERAAWLDEPEREQWIPTPALVDLLNVPPKARVLDFGTGTGRYALALAQARPDVRVVAYDVQPEMLVLARQRFANAPRDNVEVTDHAGGRYDRILALNVLHEIDNEALRRLAALLERGGIALVIDWDATIERPTGPPREHAHSPDEARERLRENGLEVVERVADSRFPYHFIFRARSAAGSAPSRR